MSRRSDNSPARIRNLTANITIADDAIWWCSLIVVLHMVTPEADTSLACQFGRTEAEWWWRLQDAFISRRVSGCHCGLLL